MNGKAWAPEVMMDDARGRCLEGEIALACIVWNVDASRL